MSLKRESSSNKGLPHNTQGNARPETNFRDDGLQTKGGGTRNEHGGLEISRRDLSIYRSIRGCLRFTTFRWVGKHINIIMKPTNFPYPRHNPQPNQKSLKKWHLGHFFFPKQIFFRALGLVLHGKQTTRNLTQPNSPQTP